MNDAEDAEAADIASSSDPSAACLYSASVAASAFKLASVSASSFRLLFL